MGKRYLQDILDTMGEWVDALKFAGGSFSLMPRKAVKEIIDLCHTHNVLPAKVINAFGLEKVMFEAGIWATKSLWGRIVTYKG